MAEPTDMLAREIDEELRRERLLKFWDQYGTYILAMALAVVVGVGGYKFYESRRAQANVGGQHPLHHRAAGFRDEQAR